MTFVDHFLHILDRFIVERYGGQSRVQREEIEEPSTDIERMKRTMDTEDLKRIVGEDGEDER